MTKLPSNRIGEIAEFRKGNSPTTEQWIVAILKYLDERFKETQQIIKDSNK